MSSCQPSRGKLFGGFPGYKPVPPGWFKIVCWFYVGNTQRLTESGFMEKPGIEPATPGLQGIALIHYTMGASSPSRGKKETNYDFIARARSAEHFNFKGYSIERGNLKKYDFLFKTVGKW